MQHSGMLSTGVVAHALQRRTQPPAHEGQSLPWV